MNASFREYAETQDYLEVLKVTISPKGEYSVPSEKKGRIAEVSAEERTRLRAFFFDFCCRLECAPLDSDEERESLRLSLTQFCARLEVSDPGKPAAAPGPRAAAKRA